MKRFVKDSWINFEELASVNFLMFLVFFCVSLAYVYMFGFSIICFVFWSLPTKLYIWRIFLLTLMIAALPYILYALKLKGSKHE